MNFGTPVPLLIGIVLILGAVALFFLDKIKPGYGRDSDKVYAILWLISGVFLLGHLTMELLASFQQLIMAGMLISLTIENVLSRKPRDYASPAVAEGPLRSEAPYRPSRGPSYRSSGPRMNVRAELENEGAYRPRFPEDRRMLEGRGDVPARGPSYREPYPDRYGDDRPYQPRPTPPEERPAGRLTPSSDRIRRRRPRSVEGNYDIGAIGAGWDDPGSRYPTNTGGYSGHAPAVQSGPAPGAAPGQDDSYVDYRPVDYPRSSDSQRPPSDYGSRY